MIIRRAGLFILSIALLPGAFTLALNPAIPAFDPSLYADSRRTGATNQLSAERIARHVQFLASDKLQGRRAGTPSADEAAAYIEKEFRSYGLKTASSAGFLQPFTFVSAVKLGEQNSFQVKTPKGTRSIKVAEDFMPLAFSASNLAAGDIVFVGYGISAPELQFDSYAGVDPKGKIVMMLRGSPDGDNPHGKFAEFTQPGLEIQNKTLKAREKGARGVIFISGEKNFREDRLSRMRHDLNFLDSGIPTSIISVDAASSILGSSGVSVAGAEAKAKEPLSAFVVKEATIEFKTDVVKIHGKSANVVAVLPGNDPRLASEYVIIGAHYDHLGLGGPESLAANPESQIHHGADDNASGTAGLLELARVLTAQHGKIKRSIMFIAFSGEELGLLGSGAYTKNPIIPLASTVAMLNMDMIGRLRNGSLFVGGVGTSPTWKPLIEKLNGTTEPAASAAGHGPRFQLGFGEDGFGPSDHQSFYVRDVPVLFFFTGTHEDYHKPSDTADKINAEGLKDVAELVSEIAVSVANEPQRIAFTKVKMEQRPVGRGFRVYLGTVPNYSDQSDGMKLDGVRPGSPAEKAGLRAGDLIVKLGKMAIKNVYDYTYALGEMRGGEEVEAVIRRDGKEMTMKITPEKRQ
jgi:peptidase M28-like protein/PDZ domain-containing protein